MLHCTYIALVLNNGFFVLNASYFFVLFLTQRKKPNDFKYSSICSNCGCGLASANNTMGSCNLKRYILSPLENVLLYNL